MSSIGDCELGRRPSFSTMDETRWYESELNAELLQVLVGLTRVREYGWEDRGYFSSPSGTPCFIDCPEASDINIHDVALSLSRISRWGGRTRADKIAFSVAQHSVICSYLVPQEDKLEALLHDATEAYLGDVISPLKRRLKDLYAPIERRWALHMGLLFRARLADLPVSVKCADLIALEVERWDLMRQRGEAVWGHATRPTSLPEIKPLNETESYFLFQARYEELKRG